MPLTPVLATVRVRVPAFTVTAPASALSASIAVFSAPNTSAQPVAPAATVWVNSAESATPPTVQLRLRLITMPAAGLKLSNTSTPLPLICAGKIRASDTKRAPLLVPVRVSALFSTTAFTNRPLSPLICVAKALSKELRDALVACWS